MLLRSRQARASKDAAGAGEAVLRLLAHSGPGRGGQPGCQPRRGSEGQAVEEEFQMYWQGLGEQASP